MSDTMNAEYSYLREEHENNRKFVFERPLLIVGATLASAITISDRSLLIVFPIPLISLLYFNIWFTHNRMESSSRIVSYLQLIHEGRKKYSWIGWENSVRIYRNWIYDANKDSSKIPTFEAKQFDSMAFYAPIFYFHILSGLISTLILSIVGICKDDFKSIDVNSLVITFTILNIVFLVAFLILSYRFRPSTIKYQIEFKRLIWEQIFQNMKKKEICTKEDNSFAL